MVTGLYAAARGMMTQLEKHSVYADNLANANTTGYRRQCVGQSSLNLNTTTAPATNGQISFPTGGVDMGAGPVQETNNPLDIALRGAGLLSIQTPQGICYSRDGRLTLNSSRQLVTIDGHLVLGQNGPVTLPPGDVTISPEGNIIVGGQQVDRLAIVEFDDPTNLRKLGGNLLQASAPPAPAQSTTVAQGYIEGANVRVVSEMTAMMQCLRVYEANAAAFQEQAASIRSLMETVAAI